jgi:hypothetical protein
MVAKRVASSSGVTSKASNLPTVSKEGSKLSRSASSTKKGSRTSAPRPHHKKSSSTPNAVLALGALVDGVYRGNFLAQVTAAGDIYHRKSAAKVLVEDTDHTWTPIDVVGSGASDDDTEPSTEEDGTLFSVLDVVTTYRTSFSNFTLRLTTTPFGMTSKHKPSMSSQSLSPETPPILDPSLPKRSLPPHQEESR